MKYTLMVKCDPERAPSIPHLLQALARVLDSEVGVVVELKATVLAATDKDIVLFGVGAAETCADDLADCLPLL